MKPASISASFAYAPEANSKAHFSHLGANPPVWGGWSKVRDGPSLNAVSVRPRGSNAALVLPPRLVARHVRSGARGFRRAAHRLPRVRRHHRLHSGLGDAAYGRREAPGLRGRTGQAL